MNILIPDSWLREYLITDAKPDDIARCLSLCGPSVERINRTGKDFVYDIEVTTNRVDCMSIYGIAREAAAILPQFKFKASLKPIKFNPQITSNKNLGIKIVNDPKLCNRILAIKLEGVSLGPSPDFLKKKLELVGQRPLNNIIDITNYLMWELGHPVHAFDYDSIKTKKIVVRQAKKGEKMVTLDLREHILNGGEIVFDDGKGSVIDLPGVMGTKNTVVSDNTKNVLLWIEHSDPILIRKASMGLSIRTQAAVINEKNPDPELGLTVIKKAVELAMEIAQAKIGSNLVDIYPNKTKLISLNVNKQLLDQYLGAELENGKITDILKNLGFSAAFKKFGSQTQINIKPPSWRAEDITIPQDIIEEIARIYGYHNIENKLPVGEIPPTALSKDLYWENEIKIRLRDWGFSEIYTYSMVSEKIMDIFNLDKSKAYQISNPLSRDWIYMRPHLMPGVLEVVAQNQNMKTDLRLFELSNVYQYRSGDLPLENPVLLMVWTGDRFLEAKGLAQSLFDLMGLEFIIQSNDKSDKTSGYLGHKYLSLGKFGSLGLVDAQIRSQMEIKTLVTGLYLDFKLMVQNNRPGKSYRPISKYPPSFEDLALIVRPQTRIGDIINAIKDADKLIESVTLLDTFQGTKTFHLKYQSYQRNLTAEDIRPIREKILKSVLTRFNARLKE